ncbi:MAG TPA: DUF11 domain-containing protein [Candidatus Saccharibacteria bacterium]|nr:DUF11 domain-containing protein [Candidatus Saccharibacteria bacterium]
MRYLIKKLTVSSFLLMISGFALQVALSAPVLALQDVSIPAQGSADNIEITNSFVKPPSINPSPQQGGDGVRAIPTKDRVYAIYHHSDHNNSDINTPSKWDNLDASCIEKSSGSVCPGFPKAIMLNGKHIITEDGSSFGTVDYHNLDAPKVYFGAANDSSSGIACLDLATGNECGYTITDNAAPPAYPSLGGDILHKPNIQTLPYDNENDFDNFNGTIYYFYDAGGVSRVGCQVVNNSYGGVCNVPSVNYSNLFGERLVSSYGSKAYVLSGVYNNGTNSRIVCYDKATNSDCGSGSSGWDTGTITQYANVVPIPFPDLNKVCIGITGQTYVDPNKFSCVDLTSGAYVVNSTGNPNADAILNQIFKQGDTTNVWFPSYIKGKLYLSNVSDLPQDSTDYLDKDMFCWNFTTSSECSEFSGGVDWSPFMVTPGITEDYSYAGDRYTNYRCAWALGDEGFPIPFRLDGQLGTGGCLSTTTDVAVDLEDYLCEADRGIIKSISLVGVDLSIVDIATIRLTDANGAPILISGNQEPDIKALGGSIDISSLGLSYVNVRGQLILNTLGQWDDANPPKLKVTVEANSNADNLIASNCPVDLTADKTSNFSQLADTAGVGTEFEYTLTFTNNGPNDAYNARVTDTLPANNILELSGANPFSYTTSPASTTVSCSPASSTTSFTCDINKLIALTKDPAAKVEVKVKVKLAQAYLTNYLNSPGFKTGQDFSLHDAIGNLTNTVSIATGNHPKTNQPQAETDLTNNQDTVTDQPQAADIELVKLVSPINTAGNPILTSNAGAGWETPYQRYVTSTGQVYVSQDIVPGAEGWDVAKLDYMIFVINRGPNTQKAVKVQDVRSIASGNLPSIDLSYGVKEYALTTNPNYSTATLQGSLPGISAGSTTIDWPVGDMTSGYAEALFYRTDYSSGTGDYTNFAQNTTEGADRDPDSNSDNCNIQDSLTHEDDCDEINVSKNMASLTINKSASPTEVTGANQDVTYTIVIANNGSLDYASNEYSVDDTLPEGLDYVSSTPTGKCNYDSSSRKISCSDLGPLPAADAAAGTPAGSVTIIINTKTNASVLTKTTLNNVACVASSLPIRTQDNKVCDSFEIPQNSVDLELSKSIVGSSGIYIGDSFQYKITLVNKGPAIARNVVIKETYPPSVEFVSAAPEVGSYDAATHQWTVPQIGVGQTINLLINAKALEYKDGDNTKNLAEVTGCKQGATSSLTDCDDPDSDMNNCQNGANKEDDCGEAEFHEPIHDIVLTKSIANQKESYSVGDTVEYLITVTNNGPDTAKRMVFKDTMPSQLEYLYNEAPQSTVYNAATHEWYVRSLAAGETVQLKIVARIKEFTSTIVNLVEWTGCKDEAGKEVRCGKDPDSTPNNCNKGTNKEDDCDQKDIKLSGGKGVGIPVTGALVGKIIAGATGIALAAYLIRDLYFRAKHNHMSER